MSIELNPLRSIWPWFAQQCDYHPTLGSQSEVVRTPDCEDEDKRCARWVEKRGSEYCQSNNYVKKSAVRAAILVLEPVWEVGATFN